MEFDMVGQLDRGDGGEGESASKAVIKMIRYK